jgi:hypothetical protein
MLRLPAAPRHEPPAKENCAKLSEVSLGFLRLKVRLVELLLCRVRRVCRVCRAFGSRGLMVCVRGQILEMLPLIVDLGYKVLDAKLVQANTFATCIVR